jgi:hypothetical protein
MAAGGRLMVSGKITAPANWALRDTADRLTPNLVKFPTAMPWRLFLLSGNQWDSKRKRQSHFRLCLENQGPV